MAWPRMSLRMQLSLLILVAAAVPVVAVAWVAISHTGDELRAREGDYFRAVAGEMAETIDREVESQAGRTRAAAGLLGGPMKPEALTPALARAAADWPECDLLVALDGKGAVLAAFAPQGEGAAPGVAGQSLAGQAWLADALARPGKVVLAEPGPDLLATAALHRPTNSMNLVVALPGEASTIRAVSARVSWERSVGKRIEEREKRLQAAGKRQSEMTLINRDGVLLFDRDPKAMFQFNLKQAGLRAAALGIEGGEGYTIEVHKRRLVEQVNGYAICRGGREVAAPGWVMIARQDTAFALAPVAAARAMIVTVALVGLGVVLAIGFLLAGRIVRAIRALQRCVADLARGNLRPAAPPRRGDELGELGDGLTGACASIEKALGVAEVDWESLGRDRLQRAAMERQLAERAERERAEAEAERERNARLRRDVDAAVEVVRAMAAGDFSRELAEGGGVMGQLAEALNSSVRSIRATLGQVQRVAVDTAQASREVAGAAGSLSSGAQQQAARLEETTSNLLELSSTIQQNSDSAQQASTLAAESRQTAEQGGRVVQDAVSAMGEISRCSSKIVEIISTIDEIAFQTNLLALNAAVEAARAGESGRGFAVVAAEVRNLAQQSGLASKEIKSLILETVSKVENGSALITQSGGVLQQIVGSVTQVSGIVDEIARASREQWTGTAQITSAISAMDSLTQQNASATEELAGTSESLAAHGATLLELIGQFHLSDRPARVAAPHAEPAAPARRNGSRRNGHASGRN